MTIHLCRDFLTLPSASSPGTNMYALSIFMTHCLNFGVVGHTNFPLTTGSWRIAEGLIGDRTASINLGSGREYEVLLPTASHVVSDTDINRILVLKSEDHPRYNSGLFRVTSASIDDNTLLVDYRSSETPPAQDGLTWRLYESEELLTSSWSSGSNGLVGYNSNKNASASRIMLRNSTELNDWSVRFCLESDVDLAGAVPVGMSIAPGWLDEDAQEAGLFGDFTTDDHHLHGPLWHNTTASVYRGSAVGIGYLDAGEWTSGQWRINMIGDDVYGTVLIANQSGSFPNPAWAVFGLPDDEEEGLRLNEDEPNLKARRLFVIGTATNTNFLGFRHGFQSEGFMQGMAWGLCREPIPCVISSYANIRNPSTQFYAASTADNTPFTGATELLDVELIAGTLDVCQAFDDPTVFDFEPRRLGLLPYVKMGRINFGDWTVTGDTSGSWLHTDMGVYISWGGPIPSDITTGSNYTELVSASLEAGTGMSMLVANDPGSDPEEEVTEVTKDVDANRLVKTYSYFRQEPRLIQAVKQGSNPAKP